MSILKDDVDIRAGHCKLLICNGFSNYVHYVHQIKSHTCACVHAGACMRVGGRARMRARRVLPGHLDKRKEIVMESTSCDVHHDVQQVEKMDKLKPAPISIKEQMPGLSTVLRQLAENLGRDQVQRMVEATVCLRAAFDADDYLGVNAAYRLGHGWIVWEENGYCFGVPEAEMRRFAQRHRRAR